MRRALETAGFDVAEAADGAEGLQAFEAMAADVVVTDLLMPNKDGVETIIELRRDHPNVKIIAITGGGSIRGSQYLDIAGKLGADRLFEKPFRLKQVVNAVQELVSGE